MNHGFAEPRFLALGDSFIEAFSVPALELRHPPLVALPVSLVELLFVRERDGGPLELAG